MKQIEDEKETDSDEQIIRQEMNKRVWGRDILWIIWFDYKESILSNII